jgi:hypothetical protein
MHAAYSGQQLFPMHDVHRFAPRRSLHTPMATTEQAPTLVSASHTHARPDEQVLADVQRSKQTFSRQTPPLAQSALVEHADEQTPGMDS